MPKDPLKSPELYINRELSWLEFNHRVLQEGLCAELPLLERLKFLAIVAANLDEFFLVRVAGLMRRRAAKSRRRDPSGMTPAEQLSAISRRAHEMVDQHAAAVRCVFDELAAHGLSVLRPSQWSPVQRRFLQTHFVREIQPILTPLAIEELSPRPLLPNQQLHIAAMLTVSNSSESQPSPSPAKEEQAEPPTTERLVIVPVPSQLPRWVSLPTEQGVQWAALEDVIAENLSAMYPGGALRTWSAFRITRDADVVLQDDEEVDDLLHAMEEVVLARRRRNAVRLCLSARPDAGLRAWLADWLKLGDDDVYETDAPLEASSLMEIVSRPGFDELKIDDWPPQTPRDLIGVDDLWQAIQSRDVLLMHPYESFDPVVKLVEQAADDPHVLAIKQTLYRTSGDSPIVRALGRAAQHGKEVIALVELKARFDEWRNVHWARRLEDSGVHVIYGVAGFKTHAKALLIVRRHEQHIQRFVHLATGNYNDRTARQYCDIGLLTADREIAADVAAFFNLLTGYSESVGWTKLAVAPIGLRQKFIDLIDREVRASTSDCPGLIMAKINSLEDPEICRSLYRASRAGVKVLLNVRGICCLRPNVPGFSDHIEVRSIVDRFLEHARVFYFRNGGHDEVYLSSADWMRRNLSKRLELMFPIVDPKHRRRLIEALELYFADNTNSWLLQRDGDYAKIARRGPRVRAQQTLYRKTVDAVRQADNAAPRFRPLTRPTT
ncbi:MAG: polyphosphate kinase 1 [Thermoguttaceae bacterium]